MNEGPAMLDELWRIGCEVVWAVVVFFWLIGGTSR